MAEQTLYVLRSYKLAYLAGEERTGKTLSALMVAKKMSEIDLVIVITKKVALDGWKETSAAYPIGKPVIVTNYHQMHKVPCPTPNTLIIVDEAHAYVAGYPKRSAMWQHLRQLCKGRFVLFASATPHAQGPIQLFNQLALSDFSPWKRYKNFYQWHDVYGERYTIKIQGRDLNQYDRVDNDRIMAEVKHLFITMTRAQCGFKHEPKDVLHYITLNEVTRSVYNELMENKVVEFYAGLLVCETMSKLRPALHMIEGGVTKIGDTYLQLKNREKIDYILEKFGDTENIVIMYNYIAEGHKLAENFKKAKILHATTYAEGVDLSMYEHLIIYSMNFSTAKHTQRRARQANMLREEQINVHFLLVKKAVSEQVYKTVALNKRNFVDSVFEKELL